eukprot:CAMPEP_0172680066 /NCGR_PEP_ID=MMETSP1074-20121228/16506_1 /TAXON_ID=2916 /ORGANISM="Ceratium fusus, Strain PA161109" /LENGTH=198 /DNA_ID=CAMNT_0013498331 /DNA_START=44 /DNA_END=637 /DNA_ORIENTATION=-
MKIERGYALLHAALLWASLAAGIAQSEVCIKNDCLSERSAGGKHALAMHSNSLLQRRQMVEQKTEAGWEGETQLPKKKPVSQNLPKQSGFTEESSRSSQKEDLSAADPADAPAPPGAPAPAAAAESRIRAAGPHQPRPPPAAAPAAAPPAATRSPADAATSRHQPPPAAAAATNHQPAAPAAAQPPTSAAAAATAPAT